MLSETLAVELFTNYAKPDSLIKASRSFSKTMTRQPASNDCDLATGGSPYPTQADITLKYVGVADKDPPAISAQPIQEDMSRKCKKLASYSAGAIAYKDDIPKGDARFITKIRGDSC